MHTLFPHWNCENMILLSVKLVKSSSRLQVSLAFMPPLSWYNLNFAIATDSKVFLCKTFLPWLVTMFVSFQIAFAFCFLLDVPLSLCFVKPFQALVYFPRVPGTETSPTHKSRVRQDENKSNKNGYYLSLNTLAKWIFHKLR